MFYAYSMGKRELKRCVYESVIRSSSNMFYSNRQSISIRMIDRRVCQRTNSSR